MPFTRKQLEQIFGRIEYRENPKRRGAIIITNDFKKNIVAIQTRVGTVLGHRLIQHQIKGFIDEAHAAGLIKSYDGCFVPRHINWNPARPLSGHSYGCDIDINVAYGLDGAGGKINYGANSYQPPELIRIAAKYGFEWGGYWRSVKDGMHFSCIKLLKAKDFKVPLFRVYLPASFANHCEVLTGVQEKSGYKMHFDPVTKRVYAIGTKESVEHIKRQAALVKPVGWKAYIEPIKEAR